MDAQKEAAITVRVNKATKNAAQAVFKAMGMDLSTGISIYLIQVAREKGLPFKPDTITDLDRATITAHEEVARGQFDSFPTVEDWWKELAADGNSTDKNV